MMTYRARIVAVGLFVADGLTDKMLITFDSNGPKDCLDYSLSLETLLREESLFILPVTPCYWPGSATSLPPWARGRSRRCLNSAT